MTRVAFGPGTAGQMKWSMSLLKNILNVSIRRAKLMIVLRLSFGLL